MKLGPPYANVAATGAGEAGGRAGPVALLAGRLTVRMATGAGVMTSAATGAGVAVCDIGAGTGGRTGGGAAEALCTAPALLPPPRRASRTSSGGSTRHQPSLERKALE